MKGWRGEWRAEPEDARRPAFLSFPNLGWGVPGSLCLSPGLEDTGFGGQCEHGSVPELYVQ